MPSGRSNWPSPFPLLPHFASWLAVVVKFLNLIHGGVRDVDVAPTVHGSASGKPGDHYELGNEDAEWADFLDSVIARVRDEEIARVVYGDTLRRVVLPVPEREKPNRVRNLPLPSYSWMRLLSESAT